MTVAAVAILRKDALPEGLQARADCGHEGGCGCVHPRVAACCFACPLPQCRYDQPGGVRAIRNADRDPEIVALYRSGLGVDRIAERFNLSRRSVFRVVAEAVGVLPRGIRR